MSQSSFVLFNCCVFLSITFHAGQLIVISVYFYLQRHKFLSIIIYDCWFTSIAFNWKQRSIFEKSTFNSSTHSLVNSSVPSRNLSKYLINSSFCLYLLFVLFKGLKTILINNISSSVFFKYI